MRVRSRARSGQARSLHLVLRRVPDRLRIHPADPGARRRPARCDDLRFRAHLPRAAWCSRDRSGCSRCRTSTASTTTSCASPSRTPAGTTSSPRRSPGAAAQRDLALLRRLQGPRPRQARGSERMERPRRWRRSRPRAGAIARTSLTRATSRGLRRAASVALPRCDPELLDEREERGA